METALRHSVLYFNDYWNIIYNIGMIFDGMWKGVLLGFTALSFVFLMFFFVFSKIMPGIDDDGEEISPEEM
jgi:hypothetical protein